MKSQPERAICLAHPGLGAGGSEAVAMALLEALKERYETTLVTGTPFECDRLNDAYHTNLDPNRIRVRVAPMPPIVRKVQGGDAIRGAFFGRFVRSIARDFDICISAYNFMPFGRPAIQFIADFSWDDTVRREFDPVSPGLRGLMQRASPARSLYLATSRAIAGGAYDPASAQDDIVVANSQWSADLLSRRYGISSRVIYPPVHAEPIDPNGSRSGDFVLLGRVAPDKRIDEAIEVLARVRARGHTFNFHVIGPLDGSAYSERLRGLARKHGNWVRLRGGIYGSEKFDELARHSYALHMRAREPFGIAVAEQVKMGLIPFVPAESAPAEIVNDPRLCFDNADHAVEVIDRVLGEPEQHVPLRGALAARGHLFSKERFNREALALASSFMSHTSEAEKRAKSNA